MLSLIWCRRSIIQHGGHLSLRVHRLQCDLVVRQEDGTRQHLRRARKHVDAAPPAALSHILAQPPEEPPQERSSPPRSRQPTKEYIDTREARVQQRWVSQLICGPGV